MDPLAVSTPPLPGFLLFRKIPSHVISRINRGICDALACLQDKGMGGTFVGADSAADAQAWIQNSHFTCLILGGCGRFQV
jgi:hypothetical protein